MAEARNSPPVNRPKPQNQPAPESSHVAAEMPIRAIPVSASPQISIQLNVVTAGPASIPAQPDAISAVLCFVLSDVVLLSFVSFMTLGKLKWLGENMMNLL